MNQRVQRGLPHTDTPFVQKTELDFLKDKLAETTLLLEVLAKINSLFSKGKKFEEFCVETRDILSEKFGFKHIKIWIRDDKKPDILKLVTPDSDESPTTLSLYKGIIGKSIREGITICASDVSCDPDYLKIISDVVSELCIPLKCEGVTIGAINIETETMQTFEGKKQIIEFIADNLSHSLKFAMLYQTEEQFHQLVETMSEGVWVGDPDERTTYTNSALQKMTGFTEEELKTKLSYDLFDEPSKKIVVEEVKKRRMGISSTYEASLMDKNGESIPVIVRASPFGNGPTMATFADLRAIKKVEKKLERTERFLASITQYCREAIIGMDEYGTIQSWNMGAEQMFGFKEEEIIGKSKNVLVPEDRINADELNQLISEAKSRGFVRNFETTRLHKNGRAISVSLTMSIVRDEHGKIIGLSALYHDITARKKWEHEVQDKFEKMQEAYREMGKQRRYLDYLAESVSIMEAGSMKKKQIADFAIHSMLMITKVDAATLRLLDKSTGKLHLIAQSGLSEEWWSKKSIQYEGSLAEKAFGNGYPTKILDIISDPKYTSPALARKNNLRSALVIPLIVKGEFLGSLTLYISTENNLTALDEEFTLIFAKQTAIALKLAN